MKGGTELTNPQLSTLLLVFRHEAWLHPALSRPPASARRARPRLSTSVPKRRGGLPAPARRLFKNQVFGEESWQRAEDEAGTLGIK